MTDTQYIENVEKVLVEVHQISLVNISLPNPMHRMLPVQFSCIKFQFSCIKYNLEQAALLETNEDHSAPRCHVLIFTKAYNHTYFYF